MNKLGEACTISKKGRVVLRLNVGCLKIDAVEAAQNHVMDACHLRSTTVKGIGLEVVSKSTPFEAGKGLDQPLYRCLEEK